MKIEKEGEYGKAIVTFPDVIERGKSYETILEWYPDSRLPIFAISSLMVRNHIKKIVWSTIQLGFFGRSPSPKSHTLVISDNIGIPGDTIYITLEEVRGFIFVFGEHLLYEWEMQIV